MERRIRVWQCVIEKDVVRTRKGKAGIIGWIWGHIVKLK